MVDKNATTHTNRCVGNGMFAASKNASKGKAKKSGETRGAGEDPVRAMDDFLQEESLEGFFEDFKLLSTDQQEEFVANLNGVVEDKDFGEILKSGDVDQVVEELGGLRKDDKQKIVEALIGHGAI